MIMGWFLAARALAKTIPWQAWVAVGALVIVFFYVRHIRNEAYERGQREEKQRIERANEVAREKANEAARSVANCPPDKWNRETGKCEQ